MKKVNRDLLNRENKLEKSVKSNVTICEEYFESKL